jgi:hypothetical protein
MMAINYPSGLDTLVNPLSSDSMVTVDHAGQHANANDAIEALERQVGVIWNTTITYPVCFSNMQTFSNASALTTSYIRAELIYSDDSAEFDNINLICYCTTNGTITCVTTSTFAFSGTYNIRFYIGV